jgi:hypothetical protein
MLREWIRDMELPEWILLGGFILICVGMCFGIYYNEQAWDRYAVDRHCTVKGHTAPSNGVGVGSNGQSVVVYIPGQTIYVCDGGEMIIR